MRLHRVILVKMAILLTCGLNAVRVSADELDVGRGPVPVYVPTSYEPSRPAPLVILIHGFSVDGQWIEDYLQLASLADEFEFLYAYPDGTRNSDGDRFWNEATHNGCAHTPRGWTPVCEGGSRQRGGDEAACDTSIPPLDLDGTLPGDESTVTRFTDQCEPGGSAELWRIKGGSHFPETSYTRRMIEYLFAHTKVDCNGNGVLDDGEIADGTASDCNGNGFPDTCEPDGNGNGLADSCDIAAGTSQDLNANGVPTECEPELIHGMGRVGATLAEGSAGTFISPRAESVTLDSFTIEATAVVSLLGSDSTYTGRVGGGSRRGDPEPLAKTPEAVSLTHLGGDVHRVQLDPAPLPGEWLKITLHVRGESTGGVGVLDVRLARHPGDINQDGTVDTLDATVFGELFSNGGPLELLDLNGDGAIDIRDATTFGDIWRGRNGASKAWQGSRLPERPE